MNYRDPTLDAAAGMEARDIRNRERLRGQDEEQRLRAVIRRQERIIGELTHKNMVLGNENARLRRERKVPRGTNT